MKVERIPYVESFNILERIEDTNGETLEAIFRKLITQGQNAQKQNSGGHTSIFSRAARGSKTPTGSVFNFLDESLVECETI